MQNKGFIRVFAILLVAAGLYQLSFTYFTYKANKDADEYAQGNYEKKKEFMDSLESMDDYYNFIGLRKFTLSECHEKELNLGLDLKGGMNVTLQISAKDMIVNLSDAGLEDEMLAKTIARAEEMEKDSREGFVTLFGLAYQELYPNGNMRLMFLGNEDLKEKINFKSTNEEVLAMLQSESEAAYDNSFNIIQTRIDRFGVAQPNIQQLSNGRISIELPGISDPDRVRDLLQSSAHLEFWETYNYSDIRGILHVINQELADLNAVETDTTIKTQEEKIATTPAVDSIKNDSSEVSLKEQLKKEPKAAADTTFDQAKFEKENPLYAVLTPNRSQDGRFGFGPVVGFAKKDDMPKVDSLLAMPEIQALISETVPDLKLAWSKKDNDNGIYSLIALRYSGDNEPALDGKVVVDARLDMDQMSGSAGVSMTMNSEGAQDWKMITKTLADEYQKTNVLKSIAIVLDGYVYSYPTVKNEIPGGRSQISGDFTIAEATDLANILKSGKLSARAEILNAEFVGPSLGKESIHSGLLSFVIAFLIVLLYMIFYYQKAGIVANIALLMNVFLIFGVLASLGAALTLPGIAGLILTIGMSVDANVLIFERIREEISNGKGIKLAIQDGYKNAYSAIVDANVTTLIIGIILFAFGSGPIQGFATTLIIGIITSLFCAIFITRLTFERLLTKKADITFDTKLTRNAFKKVNIHFIEKRNTFYIISSVIIAIGIYSIIDRQWNIGVDFSGGRSYIVQLDEKNTEDVKSSLKEVFGDAPEVKTSGNTDLKITTDFKIENNDADSLVEATLYEGLKSYLPTDTDFAKFMKVNLRQSEKVGPTIADDIIVGAMISLIVALLFIFFYIFVRFRKWQYGLGAVAALFHDVLIVLGLFSLLYGRVPFSLEIGQSFIAALLTVIGYSINDTVIVFDRIREITIEYPKRNTLALFNQGLNSTISRTINTSLTTILVLLAILIFGGESIRGFVFAMTIGVVVGTYSSLFIASPVAFDLLRKQNKLIEE